MSAMGKCSDVLFEVAQTVYKVAGGGPGRALPGARRSAAGSRDVLTESAIQGVFAGHHTCTRVSPRAALPHQCALSQGPPLRQASGVGRGPAHSPCGPRANRFEQACRACVLASPVCITFGWGDSYLLVARGGRRSVGARDTRFPQQQARVSVGQAGGRYFSLHWTKAAGGSFDEGR